MRVLSLARTAWAFRDCSAGSWLPARVPGCVHTDLRRAGRIPDPFWGCNETALQWIEERDWEYRTTFTVPAAFRAQETLELVADGLDTLATVRLNGRLVGRSDNMFVAHRWPVKALLRAGRNELVIRFDRVSAYLRSHRRRHRPREINDSVGGSTKIRKQQCQFGWDWGPRFVTAGIWRDLRLEASGRNRLDGVRLVQDHRPDGSVVLRFNPELARRDPRARVTGTVSLDGQVVAPITNRQATIVHPALWWPNGHGAQPLYTVELEARDATGRSLGRWTRRIGLRTIALDRHADDAGETFQFVVNGRPIFAKGANWIPAHSFVAGLTRADYARDLGAAAAAHMNMIRVWGGGIYESEPFYDLCDELGLLVWQDFMFACTLYPADAAFLRSARQEATQQVRRLRHRACLALWCGNNEVWGCNAPDLGTPAFQAARADYGQLFHATLPAAVAAEDPSTPYWPSSPWRNGPASDHAAGEKCGDTHYWDVWHARQPVKCYEKWRFRFCSEFGMQSFSSPETQATFCPPEDGNIFGATMKNHQKNRDGNQIILDYVSQRYRFPRNQDALIYLSQLNQAHCMQTGVEHYRRQMPHCMGALYWQLNDCWPVASWSSIEFTGRWRALHHVARRFFAPVIACAHVPGDESSGIGNYRHSTVREVHLYTVSDRPGRTRGLLRWDLFHLDGRVLQRGRRAVTLRYNESIRQKTLDLAGMLARHGRDHVYLRLALEVDGRCVSQDTVFLAPPRFVDLPKVRVQAAIKLLSPRQAQLTFTAPALQHRFTFDLPGIAHTSSDNYFDLYPDEPKSVLVGLARPQTRARLQRALVHHSLADTY